MNQTLREKLARAAKQALQARPMIDAGQDHVNEIHAGQIVQSILSELDKAGMVVVPREPSKEMLQGACSGHTPGQPMSEGRPEECPRFGTRRHIWAAMISSHTNKGESDG